MAGTNHLERGPAGRPPRHTVTAAVSGAPQLAGAQFDASLIYSARTRLWRCGSLGITSEILHMLQPLPQICSRPAPSPRPAAVQFGRAPRTCLLQVYLWDDRLAARLGPSDPLLSLVPGSSCGRLHIWRASSAAAHPPARPALTSAREGPPSAWWSTKGWAMWLFEFTRLHQAPHAACLSF